MEIMIYHESYEKNDSLEHFLDVLHGSQLKFLASDLLEEGFSALDIREAVERAMTVARTAELDIRQHFALVYTQIAGQSLRDCKLSKLGYALVLINARPDSKLVSEWQLKLLYRLNLEG